MKLPITLRITLQEHSLAPGDRILYFKCIYFSFSIFFSCKTPQCLLKCISINKQMNNSYLITDSRKRIEKIVTSLTLISTTFLYFAIIH